MLLSLFLHRVFRVVSLFYYSFACQPMKKNRTKIVGCSYAFRVEDVVRIYDEHAKSGLSNREILRRYIWPKYHICEKTFYNIINASADPRIIRRQEEVRAQLSLF
nr:MAG TPA: hypothetical protein [Caudoviricetes sp.]DAL77374.1 MAG TPA: hypothetical protein [Caudoviricetes sp.]DAU44233.1 MAG TPA: hypothetical protein [Caudoviricetes sp.]